MLRVLETKYETLLEKNHVREMDFTGRSLKGMVFIEEEGLKRENDLYQWIDFGLEFAKFGILKSKKK
jgi:hypothetical protein